MSCLVDDHHDNETELDEMHAPRPLKLRARRSMDLEFHDLHLDDWKDSEHSSSIIKSGLLARSGPHLNGDDGDGSSSLDDSFGEASDNQEPDKQYLEDLLDDECHPERLNLLDNNAPPRKDKSQLQKISGGDVRVEKKHAASNSDSESERMENAIEDDESDRLRTNGDPSSDMHQEYAYDLSDHSATQDDDSSEISGWNPDSNGYGSGSTDQGAKPGDDEGFEKRIDPSRPLIKSQMDCSGKSNKRSFRTVGNQSFFSKPFKGLVRTLSGGKRKPMKQGVV
jgi:hypothetical protein